MVGGWLGDGDHIVTTEVADLFILTTLVHCRHM